MNVCLETMKEMYRWEDGSEVLVPAIIFIATSNAGIHAGLKPVFVDVDPISYNMDASKMEERITDKTVAAIPVHTFGQPCEMDAITAVAEKHGLRILEDCVEANFATYKGKKIGSFAIWLHSVLMLRIRSPQASEAL